MTIEDFITSENLSNKLKDAGAPQESIMYWDDGYLRSYEHFSPELPYQYSAFTSQELKAQFPKEIWVTVGESTLKKRDGVFYFAKQGDIYKVSLMIKDPESNELFEMQRFEDSNEAEAVGKMLLYLKRQKIAC